MWERARRITVAAAALLAALGAGGCGVYVRAPDLRPGEPATTVYIVDYGRHSGLVLPRPDGTMAEFGYGQWEWYALNQRDWWRVPRILLLPSRATLGTRDLSPPLDATELVRRFGLRAAYEVRVRPELAEGLLRRLDERMAAASERAIFNESFALSFVPLDDDWYWLPYNCNTAVARWLGQLECRVTGLAILSAFTVRPAHGPGRPPAAEEPDAPDASFPPLPG